MRVWGDFRSSGEKRLARVQLLIGSVAFNSLEAGPVNFKFGQRVATLTSDQK